LHKQLGVFTAFGSTNFNHTFHGLLLICGAVLRQCDWLCSNRILHHLGTARF
jgi:hypothetical protein